MADKIVGIFTGMIAGYLIGMVIGFTVFDPNLDVWALLGFVLALVGGVIGITPFFRRRANIVLCALIGFYFGTLAGILLFGSIEDDLFELLQNGGSPLVAAIVGTLIGVFVGTRLRSESLKFALFMAMFGGFLGGYLFGVVLRLAPLQSYVGWSPSILICGAVCAFVAVYLQRQRQVST
jgi:hypothetical protein